MRLATLYTLACLLALPVSAQRLVFDDSFSDDGRYRAASGEAQSIVVDGDDRILVTSRVTSASPTYVQRLTPEGELDTTFGDGGAIALPTLGSGSGLIGLIATRSGDIFAAGFGRIPGQTTVFGSYVLRFNEDGTPHPTSPQTEAPAGARFAGFIESPTHLFAGLHPGDGTCGIARLDASGAIDSTFATDGAATLPASGGCRIEALGADAAGRIVVGTTQSEDVYGESVSRFVVVRFLADGTPDPAFGVNGRADVRFEDEEAVLRALDVAADGTITAAGTTFKGGVRGALVVRWRPSGERDDSFGSEGLVFQTVTDNPSDASLGGVNAVLVSPDGSSTLFGAATALPEDAPDVIATFIAVRLDAGGTLDTEFGDGGYARFVERPRNSEPIYKWLKDVRQDSQGRFVYSYTSGPSFQYSTIVARMIETNAVAGEGAPAAAFALRAFPNPAAGRATLAVTLNAPAALTATVHDALGRQVATFADGDTRAGSVSLDLDASRLAPGVYLVRVVADGAVRTTRISVVR